MLPEFKVQNQGQSARLEVCWFQCNQQIDNHKFYAEINKFDIRTNQTIDEMTENVVRERYLVHLKKMEIFQDMAFIVQQALMPFTPHPLLNTNIFVNIKKREREDNNEGHTDRDEE